MYDIVDSTTPRGFRDVWGSEAAERDSIASAMLSVAGSWGYMRAETPALERSATLTAGTGPAMEGELFRLFDLDGGLLALRPEMTVPIARLVASRLGGEQAPHRISYVADVFREHAGYGGQHRQFTQVGFELVGMDGANGDAECVSLAVEMLEAMGLPEFTVALGDVGVLRALLDASGQRPEWRSAVMSALHDRNLVELDTLSGGVDIAPGLRDALRSIPRLRGDFSVLETAAGLLSRSGCENVLEELGEVCERLRSNGTWARVSIDFGTVRALDYYTGIVMEAFASGLGLPLGGGGRYDGLLGRFGRAMPAAGFAFGLERVHIALAGQGVTPPLTAMDATIGGTDDREVFSVATNLRSSGARVAVVPGDADAVLEKARALGARRALWVRAGEATELGEGESK